MELFRGGTNTKNKEGYPEAERDGKNRTDEIRDPMAFYKLDDLTHLDLLIRTSSLLCYQLLMVLWLLEQLYPEQTSMVGLSKSWV